MFIVRKLPRGAMKPEGVPRCERQDLFSIQEISYGKSSQKGTKLKFDDQPLRSLGMSLRFRFRQWTLDGDCDLSVSSSKEEQIPTAIARATTTINPSPPTPPNHFPFR